MWYHQTVRHYKIYPDICNSGFVNRDKQRTENRETNSNEKKICGPESWYLLLFCLQDPWGPGGSRTEAGESPSTRSLTHTLQVLNLSSAMLAAGRTPPVPWNCQSTSPLPLGVVTLSIPTTLTQSRLVTLTYSVENSCVPARFLLPVTFWILPCCGTHLPHFFDGTLAHYFPRCDGVDVLVQHRPPWRQRRLRATGGYPFLLQGEGLCAAHLHGGSHHRLGGSGRYWGGGPLQSG